SGVGVYYDASQNGSLAAGASKGRSYSFALPTGIGPDSLKVTVVADADNAVFESNAGGTAETNNTALTTVSLPLAPQPDLQVRNLSVNGRFRRSMETGDVLFCAVDSIDARRLIWQAAGARTRFFADARVAAETVRLITICDAGGRGHYPETLFAADEAFTGSCTAKMTLYLASLSAGLCVAQFCKFLRNRPVEADLCLNVAAMELSQL
ncbi:MAG: hypothetical protein NT031_12715, partial [Planctomycetota bacterium]|nr:hypothetical protein [Planctomycetota bacterium]